MNEIKFFHDMIRMIYMRYIHLPYIVLMLTAIFMVSSADAQIIREDRIWRYKVIMTADPYVTSHYFEMSFMGTEAINGKEYHYLVAPDWRSTSNGKSASDYSIGTQMFQKVRFLRVTGEIDETIDWSRFVLMREENGKVYLYNDKEYKYTEPFVKNNLPGKFDLSLQTYEFPEDILIYDFNASIGDSFSSLAFHPISGIPMPIEVEVIDTDESREYDDFPVLTLKINDYPGTEFGVVVVAFPGYGFYARYLFGFSSFSNGEGKAYDPISTRESVKRIPIDNIKNNIIEHVLKHPDGKCKIYSYCTLSNDNPLNSFYTYAQIKDIEWSDDSNEWKVANTIIPIVEFRKEKGVVYVKAKPEWIDAETGLPFEDGTELVYADMNVIEGDMFPTFVVKDNMVTRQEKKVYALTCALLPKNKNYDALVFCDEEGNIDHTVRYIDGIGFYGPEAGVTVFNGAKLNNIYDADGNVIVEGENIQIPDYVKIGEVETPATTDIIYTIEGLRVNRSVQHLTPGLYIINGKKVAISN